MWLRYNLLTISGEVSQTGIINSNNVLNISSSSDGNLYIHSCDDDQTSLLCKVLVDYKDCDLDKLMRILNKD